MIKVVSICLIFCLVIGGSFTFSGAFDRYTEYLDSFIDATDIVKNVIGGGKIDSPANSTSLLNKTTDGVVNRDIVYHRMKYNCENGDLSGVRNITKDAIVSLNPDVYYLTIDDNEYIAIRLSIKINCLRVKFPLSEEYTIEKLDCLYIEPYFPLQENYKNDPYITEGKGKNDGIYTNLYYYQDANSLYPIFDFNNFDNQPDNWYYFFVWEWIDVASDNCLRIDDISISDVTIDEVLSFMKRGLNFNV